MITPVKVRNLTLGTGRPKLCVPIVGTTEEEIQKAAEDIRSLPVDLVEWRADWYEKLDQPDEVVRVLTALRQWLGAEIPVIFTVRTEREGGRAVISGSDYLAVNLDVIHSGKADLVDVELFTGDEAAEQLVREAHGCGIKVIMSSHDFYRTPEEEEMLRRLRRMQELGADIPKLAVMPQTRMDVLRLLTVTLQMAEQYADRPIITMSMSEYGVISRLSGETFGSCMTFGCAERASAPGQMGAEELSAVLNSIHKSMM